MTVDTLTATVASVAARLNVSTRVSVKADGTPEPEFDEEEVSCTCPNVSFVFGETLDAGPGTLFVTTRRIVWLGQQSGLAFALRFPQVVMHAVSRDATAYARPCLYLQLDDGSEDMQPQGEDEDEEEEAQQSGDDIPSEVRLVPADETQVEVVFKALCDSAALNPDEDGEPSGEGEFFYNEDEVMAGLDDETRAAVLASRVEGGMDLHEGEEGAPGAELDQLLGEDPNRFEDDDEEEHGAAAANGHS